MKHPQLAFGTPRKLPKPTKLAGRVAVLDIAFAGASPTQGFDQVTAPFLRGLGDRLAVWVDHHDHELHPRYAEDPRFVLTTKAEHGACPELVTPELVARIGPVDTICCHSDFDGLASAAKWIRGGVEPYPGCDADARAVDTRLGVTGPIGERFDRALRGRPRDQALYGVVVRHLAEGLADGGLWATIDAAAAELAPVEAATRRVAERYVIDPAGVAIVHVEPGAPRWDKTLLLLLGQERARVSVVVEAEQVTVAARFDSGLNFLELLGLSGGMPTRVSVARAELPKLLRALRVTEP
ncbi:MAG: hypothetical protein IT376_16155 [Polyangiaceae bacterium]|nr:hypothetical protein [Polyangiaceae bacterium]